MSSLVSSQDSHSLGLLGFQSNSGVVAAAVPADRSAGYKAVFFFQNLQGKIRGNVYWETHEHKKSQKAINAN